MSEIPKNNDEKSWNWDQLSNNPNINWKAVTIQNFLDIFEYTHTVKSPDGHTAFINCVFLKDVGLGIKKGDKIETICINLSLYGWDGDDCKIDESVDL